MNGAPDRMKKRTGSSRLRVRSRNVITALTGNRMHCVVSFDSGYLHYFARTTVAGVGVGTISTDAKPASLNHVR
jgi:hypothetical protein